MEFPGFRKPGSIEATLEESAQRQPLVGFRASGSLAPLKLLEGDFGALAEGSFPGFRKPGSIEACAGKSPSALHSKVSGLQEAWLH